MLTRKLSVIAVILTAVVALVFSLGMSELQAQKNGAENISAESKGCVSCHGKEGLGIGIVKMWQESKHYPAATRQRSSAWEYSVMIGASMVSMYGRSLSQYSSLRLKVKPTVGGTARGRTGRCRSCRCECRRCCRSPSGS